MLFVGLDLAWGQKNTTGGVVLITHGTGPAQVLDVQEELGDDEDILTWVRRWDEAEGGGGLLIGVDAPLRVPNQTGRRPCEAEVGQRFARFQAEAHPANRQRFGGRVRGEELVARLTDLHIFHDPYLTSPRETKPQRVMEVFPHPAHIVLFGLSRTLKYKAKPGRDLASRWAAMNEYSLLLRGLAAYDPPLALPGDWPPADVAGTKSVRLKRMRTGWTR